MSDDFDALLRRVSRQSMGQQLLTAARRFNAHLVAEVRASTGLDLRPAHTALLPHIPPQGARLSDLAGHVGVTRQAVARHIRDLEAAGLVERVRDPSDGRATLVRLSSDGRERLHTGLRALVRIEAQTAQRLGPERVELLRRTLADLIALLDGP